VKSECVNSVLCMRFSDTVKACQKIEAITYTGRNKAIVSNLDGSVWGFHIVGGTIVGQSECNQCGECKYIDETNHVA
jgi:hypothetical protein